MFDIAPLYYPNDHAFLQHKYDPVPDAGNFFRHIHANCEIHLFVSGSASFNLEGAIFELRPYDLIVIPPQNYHSLILNNLQPYERFIFNFPKAVSPFEQDTSLEVPRVLNIADNRVLLSVFGRMEQYRKMLPDEDFPAMAKTLLQEFLILLQNECSASEAAPVPHNSLTSSIVQFINENLFSALTIDDIAERFHLSKSHIQNVFCRDMQMGLKSFIQHKKMAYAKDMLRRGQRPVDVAARLGFADYTTFYRSFVKINGHPPKHYTK